jgi:hypothetical protein
MPVRIQRATMPAHIQRTTLPAHIQQSTMPPHIQRTTMSAHIQRTTMPAQPFFASVVTMATVVPTKVSAAELKLRQKLAEQRVKEEAKQLDTRVKDAHKAIIKLTGTKVGVDALMNKPEFCTLPDMVQKELQRLSSKLVDINDLCTNIIESNGEEEGDIATLQDTIHT